MDLIWNSQFKILKSPYLCGMIQLHLLFISGVEIGFILVVILLVFGADKIPEIARGLGKGIRQVKDATNDIKREINDSAKPQDLGANISKDIKKEISSVKDSIEDLTGPIKRQF